MDEKNKAEMAKLAEKAHKEATENWTDGTMECFWFDNDGNLCIRYSSGKWWHYKGTKEGYEWWQKKFNESRKRKRPSALTSTEPSRIHSITMLKVYGKRP